MYTSASVYKTMLIGGKVRWQHMEIWQSFAPTKVQIFTFLLLNNRLLTHDNMLTRGMTCEEECVMCSSCHQETVLHVFFSLSVCYSSVELHGGFARGSTDNRNYMGKIMV